MKLIFREKKELVSQKLSDFYKLFNNSLLVEKLILAVIILSSAFMIKMWIHDGHNWGGDFSLYIAQSRALIDGSLTDLYESNKYTMDNSNAQIGPYLYPFGFPLLLSGVYAKMGLNFVAMKVLCSLFLLLSIPLIYYLFRPNFKNNIYPLFIIIGIAFHYKLLSFSDNILSDYPFLFFSILTLFIIKKSNTIIHQLIIGFLIFFSYSIRDIGIVLLPALLVFQILEFLKTASISRKGITFYIIPYVSFISFFIIYLYIIPKGNSVHLDILLAEPFKNAIENLRYYNHMIFDSIFSYKLSPRQLLLSMIWIIPLLVGLFIDFKNNTYIVVYIFLYSLFLIVWPFQDFRFIIPILPFILYFFIYGLFYLTNLFKIKNIGLLVAILLSINIAYEGVTATLSWARIDTNKTYTDEMQTIYKFINNEVPEEEVIGFFKPRVLNLFVDRNVVYNPLIDKLSNNTDYLLLEDGSQPKGYKTVFETENYLVLKDTTIN